MNQGRIKILTKELKSIGGNWGGPKPFQKHIKAKSLKIVEGETDTKHRKRKKKKTRKESKIRDYNHCPFCGYKLRDYDFWIEEPRDKILECKGCGAVIDVCPCCKSDTWVKNNKCIHANIWGNCGYMGKFEKVVEY